MRWATALRHQVKRWQLAFIQQGGGKLTVLLQRQFLHSEARKMLSQSLFVGCLTSQQHASVSQGRVCKDNFYVLPHWDRSYRSSFPSHPQYTDTGPTSHSTDPITPGVWQGGHWSANFSHWYDPKKSRRMRDSNPESSALEADALTTRPLSQSEAAYSLNTTKTTAEVVVFFAVSVTALWPSNYQIFWTVTLSFIVRSRFHS